MKPKKQHPVGFEEFLSWQSRYKKLTQNRGSSGDEAKVYGFLEHNESRLKKLIKLFQKRIPQLHSFSSSEKTISDLKENISTQKLELSQSMADKNFSGKLLLGSVFDSFFDLK
ncbi:MAG: hypothetical protein QE271_04125 [Bacteriovoracaceae bacterium]|nr:hypothetical protein [Bacteriovoracaceae bacterium]